MPKIKLNYSATRISLAGAFSILISIAVFKFLVSFAFVAIDNVSIVYEISNDSIVALHLENDRTEIPAKLAFAGSQRVINFRIPALISGFGIVLLILTLAGSSSWIVTLFIDDQIPLPSRYQASFVILCSLILVSVLICPGNLISRIFRFWPLRAVGIVGYSYYLIHPLVIDMVRAVSQQYFNYDLIGSWLFLVTSIVTWIFCLFTYSYIERPFLMKKASE